MIDQAVSAGPGPQPTPAGIMDMMFAYQQTEALAAAINLGVFDAIGVGATSVEDIAARCSAAPRGVRILCDYFVVRGLLTKRDGAYGLSPDAAVFLDRRSPASLASVIEFANSPLLREEAAAITAAVRAGAGQITKALEPEDPTWVTFAKAMVPMMAMPAAMVAGLPEAARVRRVLDIAASHGEWGMAIARANPQARVVFQDWPNVAQVGLERAKKNGLGDRVSVLAGSAFEVDFGTDYDLVLLPNFLHHFDAATCELLLRKVHAALRPGGHAIAIEFVCNPDRVSPPFPARFSLTMLMSTPHGDAYTFAELETMFRNAGFPTTRQVPLAPTPSTALIAAKP